MTRTEFKQKCIELRKQGLTLTEICQILGRSKTTIYFHIKDTPKSPLLLERIRLQSGKRLKRNPKGVSWLGRYCKEFQTWSPEMVNLIAHSMFDGRITKGSIYYYNRSEVLLSNFKSKMRNLCNFEPKSYLRWDGVTALSYNSVEVANFMKKKRGELFEQVTNMDLDYKRSFLRAFFDDEGCISFESWKNSRKVRGFQKNTEILILAQNLLQDFGIYSKTDIRFKEIVISGRPNLERFAAEINFSPGVRVNGNRSNSIWKESLEKREILRRALASYEKNRLRSSQADNFTYQSKLK